MFCSYCGTMIDDESLFCYKCGKAVKGAPTVSDAFASDTAASESLPAAAPASAELPALKDAGPDEMYDISDFDELDDEDEYDDYDEDEDEDDDDEQLTEHDYIIAGQKINVPGSTHNCIWLAHDVLEPAHVEAKKLKQQKEKEFLNMCKKLPDEKTNLLLAAAAVGTNLSNVDRPIYDAGVRAGQKLGIDDIDDIISENNSTDTANDFSEISYHLKAIWGRYLDYMADLKKRNDLHKMLNGSSSPELNRLAKDAQKKTAKSLSELRPMVSDFLDKCIDNMYYAVRDAIIENSRYKFDFIIDGTDTRDDRTANAIMSRYRSGQLESGKAEQLVKALKCDPFSEEIYLAIWENFGDENGDLQRLAKVFRVSLADKITALAENKISQIRGKYLAEYDRSKNPIKVAVTIEQNIIRARDEIEAVCQKSNLDKEKFIEYIEIISILEDVDIECRTVCGRLYDTRTEAANVRTDRKMFYGFLSRREILDEDTFSALSELKFDSEKYKNDLRAIYDNELLRRDSRKFCGNMRAEERAYFHNINMKPERKKNRISSFLFADEEQFSAKETFWYEIIRAKLSDAKSNDVLNRNDRDSEIPQIVISLAQDAKSCILITNLSVYFYEKGLIGAKISAADIENITAAECIGENKILFTENGAPKPYYYKKGASIEEQNAICDMLWECIFTLRNMKKTDRLSVGGIRQVSIKSRELYASACAAYNSMPNKIKAAVNEEPKLREALERIKAMCEDAGVDYMSIPEAKRLVDILKTAENERRRVCGVTYPTVEEADAVRRDRELFFGFLKDKDIAANDIFDELSMMDFESEEYKNNLRRIYDEEVFFRDPENIAGSLRKVGRKYFPNDNTSAGSISYSGLSANFPSAELAAKKAVKPLSAEKLLVILGLPNPSKSALAVTEKEIHVYAKGFISSDYKRAAVSNIISVDTSGSSMLNIRCSNGEIPFTVNGAVNMDDLNTLAEMLFEMVFVLKNLSTKKGIASGAVSAFPALTASAVTCPNCGNSIAAGKKFCGKCGSKIEVQQPITSASDTDIQDTPEPTAVDTSELSEAKAEEVTCPNCGNKLKAGKKFCIKCGAKIELQTINDKESDNNESSMP